MNKGFSLIEVLLVIVVLVIAGATLTPVIRLGIDSWVFSRDQKELLAEGTLAMNRMIAEIGQAKELINICGPWESLRNNEFGLQKSDGNVVWIRQGYGVDEVGKLFMDFDCSEKIGVFSNNLKYTSSSSPGRYGLIFDYLDEDANPLQKPILEGQDPNGNGIPDIDEIRYVRIKLVLRKPPRVDVCPDCRDYVFQTTVTPPGLQ